MQPEGGGPAFERAWCGRKRKFQQNAAFCMRSKPVCGRPGDKPRRGPLGQKWTRSEVRGVYRRSREVDICPLCPRASRDKGKPARRSQPATTQQAIRVKRRFRRRWTKRTRPTERAHPVRLSLLPLMLPLASSRSPAADPSEQAVTRGCASTGRACAACPTDCRLMDRWHVMGVYREKKEIAESQSRREPNGYKGKRPLPDVCGKQFGSGAPSTAIRQNAEAKLTKGNRRSGSREEV